MVLQTSQKEGIPFHAIGIVLRSPEEYSRLFKEAFDNLGIEPSLREGLPFIETRAGRSLLLLLNITRRNFSRQSVMEFATFTKLKTDRFSSEGGFILTLPRWDAISIQLLAVAKTWSGKVGALLNAFDGFVEQDEEGPLVKQAVRRLSELDISSIPPSPGDFARLGDEGLQGEGRPIGRFQRSGPTVVNLMAVRGVPFKMVIVPGMVEKSFPPLTRQEALLLDQERKLLNRSLSGKEGGPLPLKAEGRLDEEG